MWIGTILCACFVVFRTWVQYQSSKQFFLNDYWICFAMLCHIITTLLYQVAIPIMYELAYVTAHLRPVTAGFSARVSLFLKLQFAVLIILWTTLWSIKFSLLFFFWRLFNSVKSLMRTFWWIVCAITASTWITSIVLQQFACSPIRDYFIIGMPTARCFEISMLIGAGKCSSARDIFYSDLVLKFSVGADIVGYIFGPSPHSTQQLSASCIASPHSTSYIHAFLAL